MISQRGTVVLTNWYDDGDRVVKQQQGNTTLSIRYTPSGITTTVRGNGAREEFLHDQNGHVIRHRQFVSATSLADVGNKKGTIAIDTISQFNREGELIRRVFPRGNSTTRTYDTNRTDRLSNGNVRRVTFVSATDDRRRSTVVERYTYERRFQRVARIESHRRIVTFKYDANGNPLERRTLNVRGIRVTASGIRPAAPRTLRERYRYNRAGQLLEYIDERGCVSRFSYYAISDPAGQQGSLTRPATSTGPAGYLAAIWRPASQHTRPDRFVPVVSYEYDNNGCVIALRDATHAATRIARDLFGNVTRLVSRPPFDYELLLTYDGEGNCTEMRTAFDAYGLGGIEGPVERERHVVVRSMEYDAVGKLIAWTLRSNNQQRTGRVTYDQGGNLISRTQFDGSLVKLSYDQRGLLTRATRAGDRPFDKHYKYSRPGRLVQRSADGVATHFEYDGFNRCVAWVDGSGWRLQLPRNDAGKPTDLVFGRTAAEPSLRVALRYDDAGRLIRLKRERSDNGRMLATGLLSSAYEYDGLTCRTWIDAGELLTVTADRAGRLARVSRQNVGTFDIGYDDNGNASAVNYTPARKSVVATPFQLVRGYDALGRVQSLTSSDNLTQTFAYNALGGLVESGSSNGAAVRYLHDAFGTPIGHIALGSGPNLGANPDDGRSSTRLGWKEWLKAAALGLAGAGTTAKLGGRIVSVIQAGRSSMTAAEFLGLVGEAVAFGAVVAAAAAMWPSSIASEPRSGSTSGNGGGTSPSPSSGDPTNGRASTNDTNGNRPEPQPKEPPPKKAECVDDPDPSLQWGGQVCTLQQPQPDAPDEGESKKLPPGVRPIGPGVASSRGDAGSDQGAVVIGSVLGHWPLIVANDGFTDPDPSREDFGGGSLMSMVSGFVDPSPDPDNQVENGIKGEIIRFMAQWGYTDPLPDGLVGTGAGGIVGGA